MRTSLLVSLLLASSAAFAQLPSSDIEQAWLDPAARGSLLVGNGETLGALEYRAGAFLRYGALNLHSSGSPQAELLPDRFGVTVSGALGLTRWLEVGATVPVLLYQTKPVASVGLGNPVLQAKIALLNRENPVALSFGVGVAIPVGTGAALGNGGIEVMPRLNLGRVHSRVQWGVELGAIIRGAVAYGNDVVGSQLSLSAMLASVNPGLRCEVSVRGFASLAGGSAGVETLFGARYPFETVELFAAMGPGFLGEPATPTFRVYAGLAFTNAAMVRPWCTEGEPYELADCPNLDADSDGVSNYIDVCPTKKGVSENNGCPDVDGDGDSVVDRLDACPSNTGPIENKGCPWPDSDGDGVNDHVDACVKQKGPAENKGCPDVDSDNDTVIDRLDACPATKGVVENHGCAWPDQDGDGVPDFEDNCPKLAGLADNQGCPAEKKQLVVITKEKLVIKEKVFFDSGRSTIQKKSNGLLEQVSSVLTQHPEIAIIQVEGHTDNVGTPEKNKKLSQDRANAVRAVLIKGGVDEKRLRAIGFGQEKPAASNDTPAGKETNRRVEFNIVTQ